MLVLKLINKRNEEQFWEILDQRKPLFDDDPNWLLVGKPIGAIHNDLQWIHPSNFRAVWVREFLA